MRVNSYGRMRVGNHYVGAWRWDGQEEPAFGRLRQTYDNLLKAVAGLKEKQAEISKSENLTPKGQALELRKWATAQALVPIAQAERVSLPVARRDVETRRRNLTTDTVDKTDVASAVLRQEIRAHIRSMNADERLRFLKKPEEIVAQAVIEAPAYLTGVSKRMRSDIIEAAIEAAHPGELAAIKELEKALETTERALNAVGSELKIALSVTNKEFAAMIANTKAAGTEPPRLRRMFGGDVVCIKPDGKGGFIGPPATEEEIATGIFVDDAA